MRDERITTGRDMARGFEGKTQVEEAVGNKAARVSLVTATTRCGNAVHAETNEATVSRAGLGLIARDLQGAGIRPETAGAVGRGRHRTRGCAKGRGIVAGFKSRECEIREEPMLRIRLLRHIRSRSTASGVEVPSVV